MANSNGIITWPVGIADLQEVLSDGSPYLGRLCRSANINMWAKFKPVIKAGKDTMAQLASDLSWKTDAQLTDPWWQATDHNYGLTFSQYSIILGQTGVEDAINATGLILLQPENAMLPILFRLAGKIILVKLVQLLKA